MPTIARINGHRFFFYSLDRGEPPHIHVESAEKRAKFWLTPDVELENAYGYNGPELNELQEIIDDNADIFLNAWYLFFGRR